MVNICHAVQNSFRCVIKVNVKYDNALKQNEKKKPWPNLPWPVLGKTRRKEENVNIQKTKTKNISSTIKTDQYLKKTY